jgi:hypothetical protein
VALLLDAVVVPRYCAEILAQVRGCDFIEIVLVVIGPGRSDRGPVPPLLVRAYTRWDRRHRRPQVDPLEPTDIASAIADLPTADGGVRAPGGATYPAAVVDRLRGASCDVIVSLAAQAVSGDVLHAAPQGVWGLQFGGRPAAHPSLDYYWDVREGRHLSTASLVRLAESPSETVPLETALGGPASGLSVAASRPKLYWAATSFVVQKLRELHESGSPAVPLPRDVRTVSTFRDGTADRMPTSGDVVRWLAPTILRKAARRLTSRPVVPHWRMAVRQHASGLPNGASAPDLSGFRWIESPRDRIYADPFLFGHQGDTWVFFEDYDRPAGKAALSAAPISAEGLGPVVPVLDRPYHLSYPCVFRDGGDVFMVPETHGSGRVELYRCQAFPSGWVFERELFRAPAVDTSLLIDANGYWFFTTLVEPRARATQLWLFHAVTLDAPWTPHPASPISTDIRNSRGAGAILNHAGRLFRPSQDCAGRYGRSFTLNDITRLTPDTYEERPRLTVEPPPGFVGTHTYARYGDLEMIDGLALVDARSVSPRAAS